MYSIFFVWLTLLVIVVSGELSASSSSLLSNADGTSCDGEGWVAYLDEKCYKLIKQWKSRDEAKDVCAQEGLQSDSPQLATIKSADEQAYLTEYLFVASTVTINVWFGAKRQPENGSNFIWDDGSDVGEFTNWTEDCPSDKIQKSCVVMKSEYGRANKSNSEGTVGQWRDVPCEMPNYVICEKLQRWSLRKLQQILRETRKELKDSNDLLSTELEDTKNQLTNQLANTINELSITKNQLNQSTSRLETKIEETKNKLVPIGFLYTQLPREKSPAEIWPEMRWLDVSSTYAGVFFRISGGSAASFGQIQEENCPKTTHFSYYYDGSSFTLNAPAGGTIAILGSVRLGNYYLNGIGFTATTGEVRPRNMAIRVWRRTG